MKIWVDISWKGEIVIVTYSAIGFKNNWVLSVTNRTIIVDCSLFVVFDNFVFEFSL